MAQLLNVQEVAAKTGLSRSTILAREKEGTFPVSRKNGPRKVVWLEDEIDSWIEALPRTISQ